MRPLGGPPGQVGLLAVSCNQEGPLAGFCNHFWLDRVVGCIPWQGGAISRTEDKNRKIKHKKCKLQKDAIQMSKISGLNNRVSTRYRWHCGKRAKSCPF